MNKTILSIFTTVVIRSLREKEKYPIVVYNPEIARNRSLPKTPTWEGRFAHRVSGGQKHMSMNAFILGDVSSLLEEDEE